MRRLDPRDRMQREGIPVTTVARTLLDLAEVVPRRRLESAFEEAERLRLLDLRALHETTERAHGRRALKALQPLLAAVQDVETATRSELERAFARLCRDHGLPRPVTNGVVEGHEVDAHWPRQKLVVELDGHAYHHTRAAFEADRVRDADLQLAGYRVIRLTHRRVSREPQAVAQAIRTLLAS